MISVLFLLLVILAMFAIPKQPTNKLKTKYDKYRNLTDRTNNDMQEEY